MRLLVTIGLLVLPAQARAASIPLLLTFDQALVQNKPGSTAGYQAIPPIVMQVVLTFSDVPAVVVGPSSGSSRFGGVRFDGLTISQLPAPDGLGPVESEVLDNQVIENRALEGAATVTQQTSASWQLDTYYHWTPLEGYWRGRWRSQMDLVLASDRRPMFPDNARPGIPTGFPTLQSAVESLAWGGSVRMNYGWFYEVWQDIPCGAELTAENASPECVPESMTGDPVPQVNMRYLTGTYAVDTAAATVPEPTTFVLVASGVALARCRRSRSTEARP